MVCADACVAGITVAAEKNDTATAKRGKMRRTNEGHEALGRNEVTKSSGVVQPAADVKRAAM